MYPSRKELTVAIRSILKQQGTIEIHELYQQIELEFQMTKDELALRDAKERKINHAVRSTLSTLEKAGEVVYVKGNGRNGIWKYVDEESASEDPARPSSEDGASSNASSNTIDAVYCEDMESVELHEGNSIQVSVNKYERNPKARQDCLDEYGYICYICG